MSDDVDQRHSTLAISIHHDDDVNVDLNDKIAESLGVKIPESLKKISEKIGDRT